MLGGTFLPAFFGTALNIAIQKRAKLTMVDLLIFAGLSAVGGFYTAKILKEE
jgi:hypothetical protein